MARRFLRAIIDVVDENGDRIFPLPSKEIDYAITPLKDNSIVSDDQFGKMVMHLASCIMTGMRRDPLLSSLYPEIPYPYSLLPGSETYHDTGRPIYGEWAPGSLKQGNLRIKHLDPEKV